MTRNAPACDPNSDTVPVCKPDPKPLSEQEPKTVHDPSYEPDPKSQCALADEQGSLRAEDSREQFQEAQGPAETYCSMSQSTLSQGRSDADLSHFVDLPAPPQLNQQEERLHTKRVRFEPTPMLRGQARTGCATCGEHLAAPQQCSGEFCEGVFHRKCLIVGKCVECRRKK